MMTTALSLLAGSAITLFVLSVLFQIERNRRERLLFAHARAGLDLMVMWIGARLRQFLSYFGAGSFRFVYRYVFYRVVSASIEVLMRLQRRLYYLLNRHNRFRKIARSEEVDTHLNAIAAHKEETQLSEAAKRKMRAH